MTEKRYCNICDAETEGHMISLKLRENEENETRFDWVDYGVMDLCVTHYYEVKNSLELWME